MVWNDTTLRQGLVQDMEDICGLGATGITSSTTLFQQFTRWANMWAKTGSTVALNAMDDWDFDDPAYTTYPSGTYVGTTNRDYVLDSTLKLLKIKLVGISYDGVNYVKARPLDTNDPIYNYTVREDPNVDAMVSMMYPMFDPRSNAIDIYPKFTTAQVALGAKVYIEFYREPKEFATTGTDTQEPGFASPFHKLISLGASYQYATLYKPDLATSLASEIWGYHGRYGASKPGMLPDMEEWYSERYPRPKRLIPIRRRSAR